MAAQGDPEHGALAKFSSDRTIREYARDIWHIGQFERSARAIKAPARSAPAAKTNGQPLPPGGAAPESETKQVAD